MPPFASRDLMVGSLPEGSEDLWAMGANSCGDGCTNDTKGGCGCLQTPADKPKGVSDGSDLAALQEQLRTARG